MCAVSAVGDHYTTIFPEKYPTQPWTYPPVRPADVPANEYARLLLELSQLKKDVEQMKKDLEAAKKQDIEEGNSDCEMEDKVELLKKIADFMDVDLSSVFSEDGQTDK